MRFKNIFSLSVIFSIASGIAYLIKRKINGTVCQVVADLSGKVILITGGNKGIGKEVTKSLANMRGRIIIAARDKKTSINTIDEIKMNRKDLFIE